MGNCIELLLAVLVSLLRLLAFFFFLLGLGKMVVFALIILIVFLNSSVRYERLPFSSRYIFFCNLLLG